MTWILGIGGSKHDYAACILRDGKIEVAIEEERVSRKKRGYGVDPAHAGSIGYCLDACGLTIDQIDGVAVNDLLDPAMYEAIHRPRFVFGHHLTHAASAWFASPFDRAAVLVVDHSGGRFRDGNRLVAETFSSYRATGNKLTLIERVVGEDESGSPEPIPDDLRGNHGIDALKRPRNSIGRLYARVSRVCDCVTRMGDGELHTESGKLMGLAAFGDARHVEYFRSLVSVGETIRIEIGPPSGGLEAYCRRVLAEAAIRGERELFAERAALAFAAQQVLEDVIVHVARRLQRLTGEHNLCLAGGVALNGIANHRILERTDFRALFVQPAAHDAGTALGAGWLAWSARAETRERSAAFSPYLGRGYSAAEIQRELARADIHNRYVEDVPGIAARAIARGKIVGFFQGRSEIGPRALGNRSVLADARDPTTKHKLDVQIKRREPYRPYAPAVCAEDVGLYFRMLAPSPHMLLVGDVLPEWRTRLPAITHVDGTARVQTVTRDENARFYDVLAALRQETGVSIALNTSMNVQGEPIVESPADAIAFLRGTQVDALFIENWLCARSAAEFASVLA